MSIIWGPNLLIFTNRYSSKVCSNCSPVLFWDRQYCYLPPSGLWGKAWRNHAFQESCSSCTSSVLLVTTQSSMLWACNSLPFDLSLHLASLTHYPFNPYYVILWPTRTTSYSRNILSSRESSPHSRTHKVLLPTYSRSQPACSERTPASSRRPVSH